MPDVLSVGDRLAIHELIALYGHIVDEHEWLRTSELFTADCRYDMTDFDLGVAVGPDEVRGMWEQSDQHPLAHHATNVVIDVDSDGIVRVLSKGIGVGGNGRVGSVTYRDIVTNTDAGWRIAERIGTLRRPR